MSIEFSHVFYAENYGDRYFINPNSFSDQSKLPQNDNRSILIRFFWNTTCHIYNS